MQLRNFSFIVLTLFILNSCTGDSLLPVKGPEGDPSTELSLAEFDDLPIPLNSKLDKEKSIIFSKRDGWYGRLTFNTSEKQINVYDVKKFCEIRYGVNFPLTSIQKIKGESAHPLYKWISGNISVIGQPRWNFHKYLISKEGKIINWFSSMTSPTSEGLLKQVEQALFN